MSGKKRFGISSSISQGMTDAVKMGESTDTGYRNTVIPLNRIELDENNPRKFKISPADVISGLKKADPDFKVKQRELEGIQELANSISEAGLLHPIIVYKDAEKYRVVAGERRFLASLLLKREDIEARAFSEKPTGIKRQLAQWFENNTREDLTLFERVENMRNIVETYLKTNPKSKLSLNLLQDLFGISSSSASRYITVFKLDADLYSMIEQGVLNNLKRVIELNKISDPDKRKQAIELATKGESFAEITNETKPDLPAKPNVKSVLKNTTGRAPSRVNLGHTQNKAVIRHIVEAVTKTPGLSQFKSEFKSVDWEDYSSVSKAFKLLIEKLENVKEYEEA